MDNANGKEKSIFSGDKYIKPSNVIFFLNNELVKIIYRNKPNNFCTIYNYKYDKEQSLIYSDFKKHRKRAYTVINTCRLFKRSRVQFERMVSRGLIPKPTGATIGGERTWQKMSYYSEDDLFRIREAMASIHKGRPRKDKIVTPGKDVMTEKHLRSLIGNDIMLYTKTEDGRFIPVWQEETW
jgi:hypothetical protein